MSWYFTLMVGIGTLLMGILAFSDQIAERYIWLKDLKSLVFKVVVLIFGVVLIVWGTIWKDLDSDERAERLESDRKLDETQHKLKLITMDSSFREEKRKSDSTYISDRHKADTNNQIQLQEKLDSSYTKSIKASNEALAKYNLVLIDSLEKATQKINIKSQKKPQVAVRAPYLNNPSMYLSDKGNKKYLNVRFISADNKAYNITNSWCIISLDQIGTQNFLTVYQCKTAPGTKKLMLEENESTLDILVDSTWLSLDSTYVLLYGTFSSDQKNEDKYEYSQGFKFSFKQNKVMQELAVEQLNFIISEMKKIGRIVPTASP